MFPALPKHFFFFFFSVKFILLRANAFNLNQSKILSFGEELLDDKLMDECNTILSAYTLYKDLG